MSKEQNLTKASYHQPVLSIYGNLADLTKQGNPATATDNSGGPSSSMSQMNQ